MPRIIVIGPDGVGKTAMVELLQECWATARPAQTFRKVRLPFADAPELIRLDPLRPWREAALHLRYWLNEGPTEDLVVADRFPFPDDWIYNGMFGPATEDHTALWWRQYAKADYWMAKANVLAVLLMPGRKQRLVDEHLGEPQIALTIGRYNYWQRLTAMRKLVLTGDWWTMHDARTVVEWALEGGAVPWERPSVIL